MFDRLRTAMSRAARPEPSTALLPMHTHRGPPPERMGYLERRPDSARPALTVAPITRTSDQDIRAAWRPVAGHARGLIQNSGFLQFGVELSSAFTVGGDGLQPNVVPDHTALGWPEEFAARWSRDLERKFRDWSHDALACDAQGRMKFGALQGAALKGWFATGDILAALQYAEKRGTGWRTSLNLIDPVRLWTPPYNGAGYAGKVTDGIEFTPSGRAVAYHIRPLPGQQQTVRIPAWGATGRRLVLHVFDGEAGTVRGISPLGAAVAAIIQTQNVTDAAILAAHISAMIVGVVTSDLPTDAVAKAFGSDGTDPLAAMMASRVAWHEGLKAASAHLSLGHGARIAHLSSGERFDLYAGKQSFDAYEAILKNGLREAARALGLGPEMLDGDRTDVSYSAARMSVAETFAIIGRRRKVLVEPLCEFALNAVAEELIDRGELPFPGEGTTPLNAFRANRSLAMRTEWRGPAAPTPDELKTVRAQVMKVANGLSSLSEEIAANGGDAEATFRQRKADQDQLSRLGLTLPWPETNRRTK